MRSKFFPDVEIPYPAWYIRAVDNTIDEDKELTTELEKKLAAIVFYSPWFAGMFIKTFKRAKKHLASGRRGER